MPKKKLAPHERAIPFHLIHKQGHLFYAFHALLFLLIAYPYFETYGEMKRPIMLTALNSCVVVVIIYSISTNRHQLTIALCLALPALISSWLRYFSWVELIELTSLILFYSYAIVVTIAHLLRRHSINSNDLFGGVSVYLLIGVVWANLFQLVEKLYPGSFYLGSSHNIDRVLNWSDYLYYSFTTLTTLGYGDMAPVTSQARSLAILEAVTGVLFVSVLISRVIALYISDLTSQQFEAFIRDQSETDSTS